MLTALLGRGVLLDIPRLRGMDGLEPGEAVAPEELDAAEKAQGVRLSKGDIFAFRTGHHRRRLELGPWNNGYDGEGKAGLHASVMPWLHERQVSAFFPDGDGETVPSNVDGIICEFMLFRSWLWEWFAQTVYSLRSWSRFVKQKAAGISWSWRRPCGYREGLGPCLIRLRFFEGFSESASGVAEKLKERRSWKSLWACLVFFAFRHPDLYKTEANHVQCDLHLRQPTWMTVCRGKVMSAGVNQDRRLFNPDCLEPRQTPS